MLINLDAVVNVSVLDWLALVLSGSPDIIQAAVAAAATAAAATAAAAAFLRHPPSYLDRQAHGADSD